MPEPKYTQYIQRAHELLVPGLHEQGTPAPPPSAAIVPVTTSVGMDGLDEAAMEARERAGAARGRGKKAKITTHTEAHEGLGHEIGHRLGHIIHSIHNSNIVKDAMHAVDAIKSGVAHAMSDFQGEMDERRREEIELAEEEEEETSDSDSDSDSGDDE